MTPPATAARPAPRGYGPSHFAASSVAKAIDQFVDLMSDAPFRSSSGATDTWNVIDQLTPKPKKKTEERPPHRLDSKQA